MEPKRLFIALLPDDKARDALQQTQDELAQRVSKARLTARPNLHMTLAFLGNQGEQGEWAARDALQQTANQMAGQPLPALKLGAVDMFAKRKGGSVIWRGVQDNRSAIQLRALRELLRLHLGAEGLRVDEDFTPHMTLARGVRVGDGLPQHERHEVEALCADLTEHAPEAVLAPTRISLMWSHRVDDALVYSEIGSVSW